MNNDIEAVLWNIVGGIIVSALTALYIHLRSRLRCYHLQRLLGLRIRERTEVRITYGQLMLPTLKDPTGKTITHPYVKKPRRGQFPTTANAFSMEHAISECEVRASTYLTAMLASPRVFKPILISDTDTEDLLDSNFIALGGPGSNYKSADILLSPANIFIDMSFSGIALKSGEPLPSICNADIDYGVILRVRSPEFPDRSWIVCAGLGEWGTSGTAWFLANKWRELLCSVHPIACFLGICPIPDFLAVVKVTRYQDQSAQVVQLYRRSGASLKKVK